MKKMNDLFKNLFPNLEIDFYSITEYNLYTFRVYFDGIEGIDLKMIVTDSNDNNSHINVVLNSTENKENNEKEALKDKELALNHMIEEIQKREQAELFSEIIEALIEDDIQIKSNFNIEIVIG